MEKFKRYLGLATAIALLVLCFFPTGRDRTFPLASTLTPLDSTVLTQLTSRRGKDMRFWVYATDHLNSCPPFQTTARRTWSIHGARDCRGSDYLFMVMTRERESELSAFEPALAVLLSEYDETKRAENELVKERYADYQNGKVARNTRNLEIELQLGRAMAKYLDMKRPGLAMSIYIVHATLLLVVLLMVLGRKQVGAVLWWPFSLVFGVVSAGARATKGIHDKV